MDKNIRPTDVGISSAGPRYLPARPDLSGTHLEIGITLTRLIRCESHADTYLATDPEDNQSLYEVKVFPRPIQSVKQYQYQKRVIRRNKAGKSFQQSVATDTNLFLIFSVERKSFGRNRIYSSTQSTQTGIQSSLPCVPDK